MKITPAHLRTYWALGLRNLVRVAGYRALLKAGIHPAQRCVGVVADGPVFSAVSLPRIDAAGNGSWRNFAELFSAHCVALGDGPPDWLTNPLNGARVPDPARPWWKVADFDPAVGDIKLAWELSRWDWVPAFAQQARQGDPAALDRLNAWLGDWIGGNPAYQGPNWKCGQEASIRIMHLAVAAVILGTIETPSAALQALIETHLRRIAPTLSYAAAQDNNHGTSEAAALVIGGSWLALAGNRAGALYARKGRAYFEERVARLIETDGSFSQYSVTYHRVMLDTLSLAECWRRHLGQPGFSERFRKRAAAASEWLRAMVVEGGDAPNTGSNDGANLLQLTPASYRDFRPSVQLASALFSGARAYPPGGQDEILQWLGVDLPSDLLDPSANRTFADGGYAVMRRGDAMAMMRFPRFRFRPGQADIFHLDLWVGGVNLLRDGGTYSYNQGDAWIDYFGGVASHNTIQFDDAPQMPRFGRFLLGNWPKTRALKPVSEQGGAAEFSAGYRDWRGCEHHRAVTLTDTALSVRDRVSGFAQKAVIRWRLAPGVWEVTEDGVRMGSQTVRISASGGVAALRLVEGHESRRYLELSPVPVLEAEISATGEITSEVRWA